ncbi:aldehyde dehydrogenase family protein [Nesterenkonia sp. LB17]|uniref:aldehyde dehydrogenase family protein n=1 Tax=unclassified Nesterenkonia TaxID=2629769 RepID=UPI001F4CF2CA|nr:MULTISPECIES: aldehyde dehydrogenase family protein [unclassified Nesterenkonia]MCH8560802.1 aldehyde dehydrogenase family protein [Nesterenkonia sp. DZ6]MCH8566239.1 aldehyde dehydrogenase family protein [Nesterenkonia sp. LB17]MCH8570882.1 aldehyde dehydrogenase family protein [Nesterenkonia sp. AY15]
MTPYTPAEVRSTPAKQISTPLAGVDACVSGTRAAFNSGRTRSMDWRRDQLRGILRLLEERAPEIHAAMAADLGKNDVDAHLTEVLSVKSEVKHAVKNLERWTRDRSTSVPFIVGSARAHVQRQPLGTVLIIGPWNYPFHLLLMPLIGALAAGNSVVLKPSELAPAVSATVAELIPEYLDAEAVQVVEGGVEETTRLLEHPFDHIFYTGNGTVASIVMAAAAKHLTPVTLELGGKSPVWIDSSADLTATAEALVWGKFSNCGQTCVAPDYLLTTPELAEPLALQIARVTRRAFGSDPARAENYGRIINERHAERLAGLLGSGRAVIGGSAEVSARYIAPTVLLDVEPDSAVMQDEIFGPILPILTVADHHEAIEFINARPKPLALYAFTEHPMVREDFLERTSSGGITFNTVMTQLAVSTLPFGGVGASGMGRYHGEYSVATFSHERGVLRKLPGFDPTRLAKAPISWGMRRILLKG